MAKADAVKREGGARKRPSFFARLAGWTKLAWRGHDRDDEPAQHIQEIKGILLIGFSIWLFLAMASYYRPWNDSGAQGLNWGGKVGHYLAGAIYMAVGLGGLIFCWLGMCWGAVLVARKAIPSAVLRLTGSVFFVVALAFLLHMAFGDPVELTNRLPWGPGGWIALRGTPVLQDKFGGPGFVVITLLVGVVSFMLATEMAFYPSLVAFRQWAERRANERGETLGQAVKNWFRQLFLGLWDFLRGARIGESVERLRETEVEPRAKARGTPEPDEDDVEQVVAPLPAQDEDEEEEPVAPLERKPMLINQEPAAGAMEADEEESAPQVDGEVDDELTEEEEQVVAEAKAKVSKRAARRRGPTHEKPTPPTGPWKLPPIELLEPPERNLGLDNREINEQARKLENALQSFRVEATVVGAQVGPTVILFELEVSQGTRLNKVTQLSQEIAAALRAQSVRIIAPIPGKATIGIEVPNQTRRKVRISELVSQRAYDPKFAALPLFLGIDVEGAPIIDDLAKMPHLLIAGTTGSGKSVCINTIIASFLLTRSPHDVKLVLIDPKMVELQMFATVPHLLTPVVTDMRMATNVINWAVEKMDGRYELLNQAGVRNIKQFNALSEEEIKTRLGKNWSDDLTPRHLSYIVFVIDEFADLMMQAKKEAEQAITRLAQKSRAVGIHVILATQRPSTDVITGVIKGNLPTRIAFQVASKVDSRVILDAMGAEKLLGGGDMLYNPPQSSKIKRVQGALVEDLEILRLVDFVKNQSAPSFNQELVQVATGGGGPDASTGFESALEDELWDEAVRVILKSKRGSASLLQRALGVGYTRASRLLDMMGEAGIVSDHKGSKAREVLLSLEEWEAKHGTPSGQGANDE